MEKALPISHLLRHSAFCPRSYVIEEEAAAKLASRIDLQIADGSARCFSHSAKNCLRNEFGTPFA
jgi:hypothetical protein